MFGKLIQRTMSNLEDLEHIFGRGKLGQGLRDPRVPI